MQKENGFGSENQEMLIRLKEIHVSNLNKEIALLRQSIYDLNKKIQILRDGLKQLNVDIPFRLKTIDNAVLEACIQPNCVITNDRIKNLDNVGQDALKRKEELHFIVQTQKEKIKALNKILVPHLIEQIKTEFEEKNACNELNQTKSVLEEIEKQIEIKSEKKDKMLKNYTNNVKLKLTDIKLQMPDNHKKQITNDTKNLNCNRETFYKLKLEREIGYNKRELIKDYVQKLIMVFLQSYDNLDKILYKDLANELAGDRKDLNNIMDKTVEDEFVNLVKNSEKLILTTDLYSKYDLQRKKDNTKKIFAQIEEAKNQLNEKIAQLNEISNDVNDALSLKLVLDKKMYEYKVGNEDEKIIFNDIMGNINNENVKAQYVGEAYSYAERVNEYKGNINDYKILIDELMKKFPLQNQNQNHGIFNMINNAQNQNNNNNIPQMEDNNNINRINIINEG